MQMRKSVQMRNWCKREIGANEELVEEFGGGSGGGIGGVISGVISGWLAGVIAEVISGNEELVEEWVE